MIRPVTCICVLLAAGSGLYLYQTKHRTLMLDRRIAEVLQQTDDARARTAVLRTQYAVLNQSDRLTALAQRYLNLRPLAPTQFVQLASLDSHLPPIESFPKPGEHAEAAPAASATAATTDADAESDATAAVASGDATSPTSAAASFVPPSPAPPSSAPLSSAPVAMAALDPMPRSYGDDARPGTEPVAASAVAHPAEAALTKPVHRALPGTYAGIAHAQPMPMAAPRVVRSSVLATASLHPVGQPDQPRITTAAYSEGSRPHTRLYAAPYTANGGSMLGGSSDAAMAPPVPVAN